MGTEAGFGFATGFGSIQFDIVLEIIRSYKEGFEKEIKLVVPQDREPDEAAVDLFGDMEVLEGEILLHEPGESTSSALFPGMEVYEGNDLLLFADKPPNLVAELFDAPESKEPHICDPYEPEIALLDAGMEMVEAARELTVVAITNKVVTEEDLVLVQQAIDLVGQLRQAMAREEQAQ